MMSLREKNVQRRNRCDAISATPTEFLGQPSSSTGENLVVAQTQTWRRGRRCRIWPADRCPVMKSTRCPVQYSHCPAYVSFVAASETIPSLTVTCSRHRRSRHRRRCCYQLMDHIFMCAMPLSCLYWLNNNNNNNNNNVIILLRKLSGCNFTKLKQHL